MSELTIEQQKVLKSLTAQVSWWCDGQFVCAQVGDLHHRVCEYGAAMSEALVPEAISIINRFMRRRLTELLSTGRIEKWPGIRLVNGLPLDQGEA